MGVVNKLDDIIMTHVYRYQEKYKFEAMRGMGIDRHLFGLYIIAKWLKLDPLPKLFLDEVSHLSCSIKNHLIK